MINEIYLNILKDIYFNGLETKPRDMKIKELIAYKIIIENPLDNIITLPFVATNIDYAELEFNWYLAKTSKISWNDKIKKVWSKYSDDGINVNSNYGHRIFGCHNGYINQWNWVKEKLLKDNDSRQAIININDVSDKFQETKDFPCTVSMQFFIRENKLDLLVYMRSNDIFYGFRNDLYCFTKFQKMMSDELNIRIGKYIHIVGSLHLYEKDFEKVEKLFYGDKHENTN